MHWLSFVPIDLRFGKKVEQRTECSFPLKPVLTVTLLKDWNLSSISNLFCFVLFFYSLHEALHRRINSSRTGKMKYRRKRWSYMKTDARHGYCRLHLVSASHKLLFMPSSSMSYLTWLSSWRSSCHVVSFSGLSMTQLMFQELWFCRQNLCSSLLCLYAWYKFFVTSIIWTVQTTTNTYFFYFFFPSF